mmetsp:Transcript_22521/g.72466  ORF Transcript_22521/g.72466 Transcript_22521/m.72466 type:complete len:247 (+) Transcript_22521:50-790(+)
MDMVRRQLLANYYSLVGKPVERQLGESESKESYCNFGSRSVVLWDPSVGLGTLLRRRGKTVNTMGRRSHGKVWLFAEEVLFLAERAQAVVLIGDREVAVTLLYSLAIVPNRDRSKKRQHDHLVMLPCLPCYWVYAHLRGLGYVVFRAFAQKSANLGATTPAFWDEKSRQGVSLLSYEVYQPSSSTGGVPSPAFYVMVTSYAKALPPIPTLLKTLTEACGANLKVAVVSSDSTVLMFDVCSDLDRLT